MTLYRKGSRGEVVRQIQIALHLYPDGIFGVNTEQAVKEFQERNNLNPDGIVGPLTLAKLIPQRFKKSKRTITELIVHCSATPEGVDYTVDDIRKWHKQQGWSDIGYHYVVYRNGLIVDGRDVDLIGAHCLKGGHNTHSIGICYVGGVDKDDVRKSKDTRTHEQRAALKAILIDLKRLYPNAKIYGHRDFDKGKDCPSFDARTEYSEL